MLVSWLGDVYDSKSSAKITAGSLAMFLSPGYCEAIPLSENGVDEALGVGVAVGVGDVIAADMPRAIANPRTRMMSDVALSSRRTLCKMRVILVNTASPVPLL